MKKDIKKIAQQPKGEPWIWHPVTGGVWIKEGNKVIARFGERIWPDVKRSVTDLFNAHNVSIDK